MEQGGPDVAPYIGQDSALQASLKSFFLALMIVWLTAACIRFLFLPAFAAGFAPFLLILPLLIYATAIFAWTRVSQPGLIWQYILLVLGFAQAGLVATIGGATTFWQLPILGMLCGIVIGFPDGVKEQKSPTWLSRPQMVRGSAALVLILLMGLIATFNRDGPKIEAHLLIRSIFATIAAMLAWSTLLIQFQNGKRLGEIKAKLLYIGLLSYFLIFNFAVMTSNPYLNAESTIKLEEQFYLAIIFANSIFLFLILFAFAGPATRWHDPAIALYGFLWAVLIASSEALAIIPILQFIALIPLIIRFPNWKIASVYWTAVLAGPVLGLGATNPVLFTNCLAATIIFAGSHWLTVRLETAQIRNAASVDGFDIRIERIKPTIFADTRSIAIGPTVAATVIIAGGALIYVEYANERQLAQLRSRAVAERLIDRFAIQLEIDEELSRSIGLRAAQSANPEPDLAKAMRDALPLVGSGHSIQWAPQAVVRLVEPRAGNEHAIGLNILSIKGQKDETNAVIETGQGQWTGPVNLVQGGQGLIYRMPVYRPGTLPSRENFVGLVQMVVNLDRLVADAVEHDTAEHGVKLWITNASPHRENAAPRLIHGPGNKEANLADFGWVTRKKVTANGRGEALHLRVLAYPRQDELIEALPGRFQGLLVLALLLAAIVVTLDQNRRKSNRAKEMLRESEAFRSALIQGAGAAVIATNPAGLITLFNPAAEALLGYKAREMVGKVTPVLFHDATEVAARAKALSNELGRAITSDFEVFTAKSQETSGETREWTYIRKDGSRITVLLTVTAIMNDKGETTAFFGVARDITQLKAAEKARADFIANISHELRTPLNAVLGYARLLEQAPLKGSDKEMLHRLNQASHMLFRLVNDVLDWSKIEAGEVDLHPEPFNLRENCRAVHVIMLEQAKKKGISLQLDYAPDIPTYVIGDATRFQQIMFNLVDNAIKFTEKGKVVVRVQMLPSDDAQKIRIRFDISDTGIGIAPEATQHLFERFRQVQEGSMRRYQGTGLGLAIVKELAELMGGTARVESKAGLGSTFTVELEFARCAGNPQLRRGSRRGSAKQPKADLSGKSILLVDDSDLVIDLAEWLLNNAVATVSSCRNGQEALDWLAENPVPDVILMDVQMPVMDGNTAVSILRKNPKFQKVPIIAMTAGATKSSIAEALAAGSNDYITKPFDPDDLIRTILKNVASRSRNRPSVLQKS